jgi:hypothetical protein
VFIDVENVKKFLTMVDEYANINIDSDGEEEELDTE